MLSFELERKPSKIITLGKDGRVDGPGKKKDEGLIGNFRSWGGEWWMETKNHMHSPYVFLSSYLRTSSATAIPMWRTSFPDSGESQDPAVMPIYPGA